MKKYLTLLLILITTIANGQSNYQDVVYLKNGSIIRGIIIEQVPNKSIKIETADRNVFVYQMHEIERITKEQIQSSRSSTLSDNGLQEGYKGIVELGYEIGIGNYGMDRFKINIINGYQINPNFSLGLGTGWRYYFDADALLIPLFVDCRAIFLNSNVSPYVSFGIGYSFDATNGFEGVGFLFNPTVGISFMVSDKSSMNVGFGYEMQKMKFLHYNGWVYSGEFTETSGAISINMGVSF